jgi:hypothetical protein
MNLAQKYGSDRLGYIFAILATVFPVLIGLAKLRMPLGS